MGFFSWNCSRCGKSIANRHSGVNAKYSRAVVILPNRILKEPSYNGYGIFECEDIYELLGSGDRDIGVYLDCSSQEELDELNITAKKPFEIKIVHEHCYNENMQYRYVRPSEGCLNQGFFFDDDTDLI